MDLKEIQLVGFKSFADKTTIRFDEGVTCIVGPNGCGKSNVADAVRWVLGEQSAKALRGGNMQDVIFNGTDNRKPLTFCEVTLVFDNSRRIFAVDVPEVSMTRRLYRSGESKYLLNGQNSRRGDLVQLFHGIGLGKEGYSIIGQGKVEQIMNARPENRRLVFEEATGIMGFKVKKQEIERRIEDANDNLYIFRQRIDEAERRLGPLAKQAAAARDYKEYSAQLKVNEANTYMYRYENAETEKSKYKQNFLSLSEKILDLNSKIDKINSQTEYNRDRIARADITLNDLQDKRLELSVGNERKEGEMKLVKERIATYQNQLQASEEAHASGKIRIGEIGDEMVRIMQETKESETRLLEIESETDVLSSAIRSLDNKIAVFERLSDENRLNQISSAEDLSELKKNLGTLSARKEAAKEKIDELNAALEKCKRNKEDLIDQLEAVKKDIKRLKTETADGEKLRVELEEEYAEMELTISDFTQDLFNSKGQIASLQDKLEMHVDMKNRFDGYKDSVRRLLSVAKTNPELKKKIHGMIADIVTTDQKYETAIETAFGGAMQNIVTPTMADARDLVNYLKRTNSGVATFLPVDSMKPRPDNREIRYALNERGAMGLATELVKFDRYYYNVVSNLLGNTLICDNINNATAIAQKYGSTFKIVTLEGDIVTTSGAVTGGSRHKENNSLLSHERKIQECKDNIERKKKYIEKLEAAIKSSENERAAIKKQLDELRLKYQDANSELAALAQREDSLNQRIDDADADIALYTETLADAQRRLADLEREEAASSQSQDELNSIREAAQEELASQKSQLEQYKEERAEKSKLLHDLDVEATALRSAIDKNNADIERLTNEKDETVKRIVDLENKKQEAEEYLATLQLEAEQKELTEEEKAAIEELNQQIEKVTKEKETLNESQIQLEAEKTEALDEISKLNDKRYKCELEITRIDTTLENSRLRMEEAYELDYEGCQELRVENFNVDEAAKQITELKRKITMLGAVNPNAVEEYADEQAHYAEMVEQRDDLQKGIEDLSAALEEIRGEMLRIFNEGFNDINENFKTTFKELFGGGKAELQIDYVEGEDPLNAGVEIIACPPGKKLTKISLLSGGERALTAIAILFAILKARPMPFCILDEIEAALDDANVDRFANYLKRFALDTQFIVITHRKPTMNQADTLFGVTMQEKGVSKIVSVKLADVETKLGSGTVD
ncbi:MAG: chromosome segregation protein SMC [Clostridia bacterium]|nr:chromosome segregation protein SMC [Clostridia bacterium]